MARRKALVIGGLGVIGRRLVQELGAHPEWDEVVAMSRRDPDFETTATFIGVDLLDRAQAERKLGHLSDVTHIFYCGLDGGIQASNVERNLALLVNPIEIVEPIATGLERIVLSEGGKVYGRHLGPFKTPAKETDPRYMPPNFYYDQEDFLRARQVGKSWTWSAVRPEAVLGFAVGNPLNILLVIGVYAAICKELGLPLRFPGRPGAYHTLMQFTDAGLLARLQLWCATDPAAANQAFNATDGDCFRWDSLWPRIARLFEMEVAAPQQLNLVDFMPDKKPVWERIVARHGLQPYPYEQIAMWPFGDFVFHTDWDLIMDDGKRIRAGFTEVIDTEERVLEVLAEFRANRIIP
jgi:nucleoside-diphosphate-sugar epimerase